MTNGQATGASETGGRELLKRFCDNGFEGDLNAAAVALGRTEEELQTLLSGDDVVDDDLEMKIRGIAQERDIAL